MCWEAVPPHPNTIDMHSWPGRCKNRRAAPELEMVTDCCLQLLGFRVLPATEDGSGKGAWYGWPGSGTEVGSSSWLIGCPWGARGTLCGARAVPLVGVSRRTDMGNAPICQSCHSEKGLRTQGNIQDLDKTPDYYGCNSEESKDPGALVSFG